IFAAVKESTQSAHLKGTLCGVPRIANKLGRRNRAATEGGTLQRGQVRRLPYVYATDRRTADASILLVVALRSRSNIHNKSGAAMNTVLYVPEITPITSENANA